MTSQNIISLSEDLRQRLQQSDVWIAPNLQLHSEIIEPVLSLCQQATENGTPLALLSGYRSYQRQCQIWDEKFSGNRVILDHNGSKVTEFGSDDEKLLAISRWSAIPGMSRHHWGTDIDIFDANSIINGYEPQLIEQEFQPSGPCYELSLWLEKTLPEYNFFRPYKTTEMKDVFIKINPEPWHLSYQPVASQYEHRLNHEYLLRLWRDKPFCGSRWCIENVSKICL